MNHKITRLAAQKKNHQRVNVYLDGEFAFGLSRITAAWLQVGQEISDEKIGELRNKDGIEVAYQKALKFLSYRPRSEQEVRQNLAKHDVIGDNQDRVIERLQYNGYIDDQKFAQIWVENRSEHRPRSKRMLAYELRQHGIEQNTIDQILDGFDECDLAQRAASKQIHKYEKLEWVDFQKKLLNYLSRRGFNYQTSKLIVDHTWEELNIEEH